MSEENNDIQNNDTQETSELHDVHIVSDETYIKQLTNFKISNESDESDESYEKTKLYLQPGYDMFKKSYMFQIEELLVNNLKKDVLYSLNEKLFEQLWDQFIKVIDKSSRNNQITDKNDPRYEELSDPNNYRFTIKPIEQKYQVFWDLYQCQVNAYWRASEIDFSNDLKDFENVLDDNERIFVKMILAFFAAADGIVNLNIGDNMLNLIQITEAKCAYGFQYAMENVHGEVYSDMLTNVVSDNDERNKLMNGFKNVESIRKMKEWACKWIDDKQATLAQLVIAFAIVEGIFFSGAFASIYWLKGRHKGKKIMNGLMKSNKLIARDEGIHTNTGCATYYFVNNKLDEDVVYKMFDEAIELSNEFANDAIKIDLIGMNSVLMSEYNMHIADRLLSYLGYNKKYMVENPFGFMKNIGILNKENFFEVRPDAYQSATNETNTNSWKPIYNSDSELDSEYDTESESENENN
jgi:ribonucleoside-diphosphate reductase subunit M2